jgi:hypothetical protein
MNYESILETVEADVKKIYRESITVQAFHDKKRRKELLKMVTELSAAYKLTDEERFSLECSALIYGIGYLNPVSDPGEASLLAADHLLSDKGLDQQQLDDIKANISSAMGLDVPETKMEQLFCDCVFSFYGDADFKDNVRLLWKESKDRDPAASKIEFYKTLLKQMDEYQYFTTTAQERFSSKKLHNRLSLVKEIPDAHLTPVKEHHKGLPEHEGTKQTDQKANKGVDTMFKISSTNQQRLSDLADNKAHILITVNSIILSAVLSLLLRKLTENHFLIIPTAMILSVSLAAMVFAILATRPSVPHGVSTRQQIDENQVNLLFFGNFYRMPIDDFRYGMEKMMESSEILYHSLITDVYMQGVVLGKKYKLLRLSYNIFMYGLIISVLAFALAAAIYMKSTSAAIPIIH